MRLLSAYIVLALLAAPAFADPGAGDVRAGNAFYNKGEFQHAIQRYEKASEKSPADARIEYNIGAAAYQAKDYDAAIEHFQKSLLTDDDKFRRDVHFNLGDAFYRVGIGREDKDIDQSIKRLESSLESFEKARALDVNDQQAVENYEFVKKVLEEFKQKKQQQEQQKSPPCPTPKKDQQQQDQQKPEEQKSDDPKDQEKQDQQDQEKKDQEKQDQGQKDQQDKQDKQDKQDDQDDQDKQEKQNDQNNGASGQTSEGQISSQKDANDMVDDFERNEMPKGLLNFIHRSQEARPVDKDW